MCGFDLTDEQRALVDTARAFTRNRIIPVAGEMDAKEIFPAEIFAAAWELGLTNCEVPPEYAGVGLGCLDHCLVLEEIAYGCAGVHTTFTANMLGAMPILVAGTEEQHSIRPCSSCSRKWPSNTRPLGC